MTNRYRKSFPISRYGKPSHSKPLPTLPVARLRRFDGRHGELKGQHGRRKNKFEMRSPGVIEKEKEEIRAGTSWSTAIPVTLFSASSSQRVQENVTAIPQRENLCAAENEYTALFKKKTKS